MHVVLHYWSQVYIQPPIYKAGTWLSFLPPTCIFEVKQQYSREPFSESLRKPDPMHSIFKHSQRRAALCRSILLFQLSNLCNPPTPLRLLAKEILTKHVPHRDTWPCLSASILAEIECWHLQIYQFFIIPISNCEFLKILCPVKFQVCSTGGCLGIWCDKNVKHKTIMYMHALERY